MDAQVQHALDTGQTIDITTIGKTSGQPRRIEIWFHNLNGAIYITGTPGRRDWYANLLVNPSFTFHLKEGIQADLPAQARPIIEPAEKRTILAAIMQKLGRSEQLETWVEQSPLVEVHFIDSV
jgi:hypothetical protein